jgi:hypothetical protein
MEKVPAGPELHAEASGGQAFEDETAETHLTETLAREGIELSGFYACTHLPGTGLSLPETCARANPGRAGSRHRTRALLDGGGHSRRRGGGMPRRLQNDPARHRQRNRVGKSPMRSPTFKAPGLLEASRIIEANS